MKQPTSKEIEEAKDYLRQRLNAELSMENNLLAIMYQAAKEIIAVSYKYNVPTNQFSFSYNKELQEEVETIIANLRELIEDYTETLAVATHTDEKEHIISFINRESHGKTLVDRINAYTTQFKKELEVAIASGSLLVQECGLKQGYQKDQLILLTSSLYEGVDCNDLYIQNGDIRSLFCLFILMTLQNYRFFFSRYCLNVFFDAYCLH